MQTTAGRLPVLALAAAVLAGCDPAGATPGTPAPSPTTAERSCAETTQWAEQVVSDVAVPLPVEWELIIECGDHHWRGWTNRGDWTITLWPDTVDTAETLRWVYIHELGHAYDEFWLDAQDRAEWRQVRGIPDGDELPWSGGSRRGEGMPHDQWAQIPAEDFAESFAFCQMPVTDQWESDLAAPPTVDQCQFVEDTTTVPSQLLATG